MIQETHVNSYQLVFGRTRNEKRGLAKRHMRRCQNRGCRGAKNMKTEDVAGVNRKLGQVIDRVLKRLVVLEK